MQVLALFGGMVSPVIFLVFIARVISYFLGEKEDDDDDKK